MQIKSQVKYSKQQIQNIFQQFHSSLLQRQQFSDVLVQLKQIQSLRTIQKLCRPVPQKKRQQTIKILNDQLKILQRKLQKIQSIRQKNNIKNKSNDDINQDKSPTKYKVSNKSYEKAVISVYLKGSQLYNTINEKMKIIINAFDTDQLYKIEWDQWKQKCLNLNRLVGCGCFG